MKHIFSLSFLLFFTLSSYGQVTLLSEDFEDNNLTYVPNAVDDLSDIINDDYYGIITPSSGLPADIVYSGITGNNYYGVQDSDGATVPVDQVILDFTGIDISGSTNLSFSIDIAEDDAADGNQDWDNTTSILIEAQIDGAGFVPILAFESELGVDGNDTNEVPRQDTDFDGIGDGAMLTDAFTTYTESIVGTGSLIDIKITMTELNAGDEDIALDQILLTGEKTDVTNSLSLLPNIANGITNMNMIIRVEEVGANATIGDIIVRIPKDPKLTFTFDNTLTMVGFDSVENSLWSYDSSNAFFHVFTTNHILGALDQSSFGATVTYDPQNNEGLSSLTAILAPGSGGDTVNTNNVAVSSVIVFP